MTLTEALKTAEDLLEQVSTAGEQNWQRMGDAKKLVRAVRQDIEKQQKEAQTDGSGDDAGQKRDPEGDAGTV